MNALRLRCMLVVVMGELDVVGKGKIAEVMIEAVVTGEIIGVIFDNLV